MIRDCSAASEEFGCHQLNSLSFLSYQQSVELLQMLTAPLLNKHQKGLVKRCVTQLLCSHHAPYLFDIVPFSSPVCVLRMAFTPSFLHSDSGTTEERAKLAQQDMNQTESAFFEHSIVSELLRRNAVCVFWADAHGGKAVHLSNSWTRIFPSTV